MIMTWLRRRSPSLLLSLCLLLTACEEKEPFEVDQAASRENIENKAREIEAKRQRQHAEALRHIEESQELIDQIIEQTPELEDFASTTHPPSED